MSRAPIPFNQYRLQPGQQAPRGIRPTAMTGIGQVTEAVQWERLRVRPDESLEEARERILGRKAGGDQ